MRQRFIWLFIWSFGAEAQGLPFERSELSPDLQIPWDIEYGPDGFLWITESQGRLSRVDPATGVYKQIWKAPDYRDAAPSEQWPLCYKPMPGSGCLGLALDPDFMITPEAYLFYSYHDSSSGSPKTYFKVVKVRLSNDHDTVEFVSNIAMKIPTGLDHLGGKLLCVKTGGLKYLYVSVGDNGISEVSQPSCYSPQDSNPNNQAWNPGTLNGKILRYHTDGTIPADNPLPGNPFFTRGHRNPQGLAWNPEREIIYETEHGDRTDDELNILEKGMNYGWKWVRGWHSDNNWPGEADTVNKFMPNPGIAGDRLVQPIFVWCASAQPTSNNNADWCSVAPSGAAWYGKGEVAFLRNNLLVTTLKNGNFSRQEVYAFHFTEDGKSLVPATTANPNPRHLFTVDANINGRLRDIAFSPDGRKIYLINNGGLGSVRDKITVYTYKKEGFFLYPNPTDRVCNIQLESEIAEVRVYDASGREIGDYVRAGNSCEFAEGAHGLYLVRVVDANGIVHVGRLILRQ